MAAARDLALAGHRVDLYDERDSLGGDFALASRLHEYPEYARIVDWYRAELVDLDVTCHTGIRVDAAALAGLDFDAIVLATGGRGPAVDLPGAGTRTVRDVREFLAAGEPAPESITIFGADREAAAVADDLLQQGTKVVMIGPQETVAHDVGRRGKIVLLPRLAASENLTTHLSSIVTRVEKDRVVISTGGEERAVDAPGGLLISHGVEPRADLLDELRSLAPRLGVHPVGDASGDGGSIHAALVTAVDVAAKITAAADARVEVTA
jgi:thioredoxin reductase